jgi:hypothetical protein
MNFTRELLPPICRIKGADRRTADIFARNRAAKFHRRYFAGGPLLFPGFPWIFEVSCCWTVGFCGFALVPAPTVLPRGAAGPLLPPGWPGMPAPEFCALGALETSGLVV